MAGPSIELEAKVAQWWRVFETVRVELTPAPLRDLLASMTEVEGVAQLSSYMNLAAAVMANDREAARVAAMLVGQNIRAVPVEEPE